MPHIALPEGYPGIRAGFMFRPETAAPLCALAQTLLHDPHPSLTAGEREVIASYVSYLNTCKFCTNSHSAIAKNQLDTSIGQIRSILNDPETADISDKLRALLRIAGKVQSGGKNVTAEDIENARSKGATDLELHDTVLIAAAFCMFNRYVDGLGTWQPDGDDLYDQMAAQRVRDGYQPQSMRFTADHYVTSVNE